MGSPSRAFVKGLGLLRVAIRGRLSQRYPVFCVTFDAPYNVHGNVLTSRHERHTGSLMDVIHIVWHTDIMCLCGGCAGGALRHLRPLPQHQWPQVRIPFGLCVCLLSHALALWDHLPQPSWLKPDDMSKCFRLQHRSSPY